MNEYRVVWHQCPHIQHARQVLYVRAASEDDARKITRDHVERRFGIEWFMIIQVTEAPPVPTGEVLS